MITLPLVSFCIPVHNSAKFLESTLQSIFKQDYQNIEVICANDHSTDNSVAILEKYADKVKTVHAVKRGAAAARNLAYAHASGTYIVFFDSDDLINTQYLSTQIQKALPNPSCVVVSKWGRFYNDEIKSFKEDKNIIKSDLSFYNWIIQYWTYNNHTTPPGRVLLPRAIVESAGLWSESLSLNDDLDFYARAFSCAQKIVYNDEACFYYRSGVGGLSSKTNGYHYQLSNFNSVLKATSLAELMYSNDKQIKKACANMWQLFIYDNYPRNKDLIEQAMENIIRLGGADYKFPCGGVTKYISKVVGWKMAKHIKLLLP